MQLVFSSEMWSCHREFPLRSIQKPQEVRCCWHCFWFTPFWKNLTSWTSPESRLTGEKAHPSPSLLVQWLSPLEALPLTSWHWSESSLKPTKQGSQPKETNEPAGTLECGPGRQVTEKGKQNPSGNKLYMLWRVTVLRSLQGRQSTPLSTLTGSRPH